MDNHITYYRNRNNIVFKTQNKTLGMKWEVQIQRTKSNSDYDWDAMGMKPPKGEVFYRRCLIDTYDIEYMEEYSKKLTTLKCTWMNESVLVVGFYDDLLIQINDLENSNMGEDEI